MRQYGNPGTRDGRVRGGRRSIKVHQRSQTGFKTLQYPALPRRSCILAELLGILAGDGHVNKYQISVTTNSTTDLAHAMYIKCVLMHLFHLHVSLTKKRGAQAVTVLLSSKNVCDFLSALGVPLGNKTIHQITPPTWIIRNAPYSRAYLRGLIDTDGSVYLDRHIKKGRLYSSICISFTNASVPLLDFAERTMRSCGLTPTRSGLSVRLRKRKDVHNYARMIGFQNPKHAAKITV